MQRREFLAAAAAAAGIAAAVPARAQSSRIVFGYTAVTDFASVFVAAEEGFFKKRNLDVELKFIPLNSTIPAAVQADSLQIGGPTPSVFLQSVDGGLDHVVLAGGGVTSKSITGFGLVARAGSGIKTAQDCLGKKIGVPGLGAFLHVTFRGWLKNQGVDYRKVSFVEAAFPQHGDLLRGGTLDAVVSADPFMSRITDSGTGYVASYYSTFLPEGEPTIIYTAKREWAQKNAGAARAFQQAVQEAAAFMGKPANNPKVRAAIGKYIKLPPEVLAKMQISPPGPVVTDKQLAYWVDLMKDQDMLKGSPEPAKLIFK
ncbi:ABC transporter substrate-binding protein [Ramlibacter sp.]|uniref:ABC transporter substrate-binding protein n=1 Tax=Ramlibacter sp. TaxID=1917967 RepID=UPI0017B9E56E|nr:ABC transporter substrate-binding protein [Ramlibacter sp.]MBA2675210.1 ABC transporter substrate-binding protein [Ramlibacter sp.]